MTNKSDKPEIVDSDCLEAFDHLYSYLNGELKNPKDVAMEQVKVRLRRLVGWEAYFAVPQAMK